MSEVEPSRAPEPTPAPEASDTTARPRMRAVDGGANKTNEPPHSTSTMDDLHGFSRKELIRFLGNMILYRRFEEQAEQAYAIGKIGGFCHLHIGQEGVAEGCIAPLRPDDYVITAYREHTQALAKGLSPKGVMAELFGRQGGVSAGNGGSMHLFDASKGFMGGHGIVGAQTALGLGIAFGIKYKKEDKVCICFMGDAAVNQGALYESMNMAAVLGPARHLRGREQRLRHGHEVRPRLRHVDSGPLQGHGRARQSGKRAGCAGHLPSTSRS